MNYKNKNKNKNKNKRNSNTNIYASDSTIFIVKPCGVFRVEARQIGGGMVYHVINPDEEEHSFAAISSARAIRWVHENWRKVASRIRREAAEEKEQEIMALSLENAMKSRQGMMVTAPRAH